jgi:hypothetical protein
MKVDAIIIRTALLALLTALAAALGAGIATGASVSGGTLRDAATPSAPKPPYDARLLSCRRSPRTDLRTATVGASMRPVAGARRLALRVDLYQRPLAGGRWALRSDVPGLSIWTTPSDPTIGSRPNDVFKYRQAVGRLVVPFAYRFKVTFRWTDAAGEIVREETATTLPCKEPDLRPDLVIEDVLVAPAGVGESTSSYTVIVRNSGRTPASSIGVGATFSSPARSIRRLEPHETAELTFLGPACVAETPGPTFLVDPANAIDEGRETNNSLAATCPATLDQP